MTTMPAYRSTETDPKDIADQIVVLQDDTEHMCARLARTRAIRLTQHEKDCDSNRSPPPSRRMSRSMPLPRRCTSHLHTPNQLHRMPAAGAGVQRAHGMRFTSTVH